MLTKRATSLAALLLVVLCVVLTVRHPALFAVMTNGDQLTIPSLVDDFLHNPHFSLSTWSLPRAPYLFPDGALVLLLRRATPDTVRLLALYAGLHALGLIAATGLVIRRALPEGGARSIAFVFALIGFALVLTLSYEPWYWPMLSLPFLPISHAGPMICGLALAAVFLGIRRGTVGWLVLTVASAALVLSDRFFIVYFIVPYVLVTVLTDRDPKRRESFKAIGAEAVAVLAGLALLSTLHTQKTDPIHFDLGFQLANIAEVMQHSSSALWLLHLMALTAGAVIVARWLGAGRKEAPAGPAGPAPIVVYVALSGLAAGIATFLLWREAIDGQLKYAIPVDFLLVFLGALAAERLLRGQTLGPAVAVALALATGAFAWTRTADHDGLAEAGAANRALAAAFDGCAAQYGLKAGLADYWIARTITMATDWRVQVNQVQPHVPVSPFFWGNNALWFYLEARTGAPLAYNFVVTPPTGRAGVEDLYGTPSRYVTCGDHELAVYDDSAALTAKVFGVIERYEPSAAELTAPILHGSAGAP
jgi:hypothetical protein